MPWWRPPATGNVPSRRCWPGWGSVEERPAFRWHPGLLIEEATLQVPFLADLVTLVDPTSRWSFLNWLRERGRLFPFYFAERFHIPRVEYEAYCRWAAERLPNLRFGLRAEGMRREPDGLLAVRIAPTGTPGGVGGEAAGWVRTRNVVLGIGTAPHLPAPLRLAAERDGAPVLHSAEYLDHRERLLRARHVTVIGSGQSGAEVLLDLLRRRPAGREGLHWLTRSPAFAPMEYSKLGLEHFTPDYTRYFHSLPETTRDTLVARQWQLHKAVDHETLAALHDELYHHDLALPDDAWPQVVLTPGVEVRTVEPLGSGRLRLELHHAEQGVDSSLTTDAVVAATGYRERSVEALLAGLGEAVRRDAAGRPVIGADHRVELSDGAPGAVFSAGAERHTHGVGTPDLGLMAHRAATVLNGVAGRERYPLPARTAFTTFGAARGAADAPRPTGTPSADSLPGPRGGPVPDPAGSADAAGSG
ncbi:lysine N(6)-hydroxylase/L-ornithine N(5)-oxygenase family protein [Streptomyces alkaliphilus]|uniref:lysine N(6)-hydroxylase/L-ornithine N(5)-oxygenase family protein n=1 Tax=Streptomyces alkaliphilus TaxID=1472722 RepID=UPI00117FFC13|nr:SidA/IucD/PvdA family monooxygenase [Streptomyces alkaliphilus]MQS08402.1 SidA/IucD/PvdA family monooxygenase [Streptomyces alkaliphilus]